MNRQRWLVLRIDSAFLPSILPDAVPGSAGSKSMGDLMTRMRTQHVRRSLLASAATLASIIAANPAFAQPSTPAETAPANPPAPTGTQQLVNSDQIVITGTRRTDRTVTNSASPIDV